MGDARPDLRRVQVLGLPIELHRRVEDHNATVRREMALIVASNETADVPSRLAELAKELNDRYRGFTSESDDVLEEAMASGLTQVDLTFDVPTDVAEACVELNRVLDEVETFCRNGDLITLVSSPELLAYRRWFLGQFISQARDDAPPRPWQGYESTDVTPVHDDSATTVVLTIDEDLDLEGAARLREVIAEHVASGSEDLVLDMLACEFIDSVGISLLLTTFSRMRRDGGSLMLRNVGPQPLSALRTAGVLELLVP